MGTNRRYRYVVNKIRTWYNVDEVQTKEGIVLLFYIDSGKFCRALTNFPERESDIRRRTGIGQRTWYAAKRGNLPILPRSVNKLAVAVGVAPEDLIKSDDNGDIGKEARTA